MFPIIAVILTLAAILFVLWIRTKDLPEAPPESPTAHLEARKARIYEGLRDLQFEYRVGKLSDEDYQRTKIGLQKELAEVLAEIDRLTPASVAAAPVPARPAPVENRCPHCGATFKENLKFCGNCGKPMAGVTA
jgi:hypothetical protein